MILLIAFAFLAGVVTIISPCILPVLPIVLSSTIGDKKIGKSRPLGVIIGFVLSFTFFTLFLSTIVKLSGIPADTLRLISVIAILGFGISLLIPKFQKVLELFFSKLASIIPDNQNRTTFTFGSQGFGGGLVIGFSLGLLWTPCVGPILASVISLAITGIVSFDAFLITFVYSLGTAIPMFLIMLGGQNLLRKVPWLVNNTDRIQKGFGILMILTAIGILFNIDRKFQSFILNTFPNYGVGLTKFEDNSFTRQRLKNLNGAKPKKEDMGKPLFDLQPKGIKAPEIIAGGEWFNSPPLKVNELKGKVILIDFWTYTCINCQRTLPYLKQWHEKYKDKGLVIIGVHSPEFEFEKNKENVEKAISDFGLLYPVVQDNNFETWKAYTNHYWPAKYFIDKEGYIRYSHFGEGAYDESEKIIQELLKETGIEPVTQDIKNPTYQVYSKTPELYLGFARMSNFSSPEKISENSQTSYTTPAKLSNNTIAFAGKWIIMNEYASPQKDAKLFLNFEAKEVFLVMKTTGKDAKVKVFIDDQQVYFGEDNQSGTVKVNSDRLYKLINLPSPGRHLLRLEFEDSNAQLYAFTFG